jgi:hypothetical protein
MFMKGKIDGFRQRGMSWADGQRRIEGNKHVGDEETSEMINSNITSSSLTKLYTRTKALIELGVADLMEGRGQ